MSLRTRLVLVTVTVVAVALFTADIAAYLALRTALLDRAGQDLAAAAAPVEKIGANPQEFAAALRVNGRRELQTRAAFAIADPDGSPQPLVQAVRSDGSALADPRYPDPAGIPRLDPSALEGGSNVPVGKTASGAPLSAPHVIVPSSAGGFDYAITSVRSARGWVVLVAFPLDEVGATLGQLALIELVVTLVVLVIVALVARRLVSLALRPLGSIEVTAARIAAGEMSQRIPAGNPRTEVGRLGSTLNVMLGRIEAALAAREASERSLRRFMTDASHELRTPLTSIRGYAELFRRGAGARPDDLARVMLGIEFEAQRLGVLVDELLQLSRLDEGYRPPSSELDLVPVVREAVEAARAVEPDRSIELLLPEAALLRADPVGLRQVIDNLLANVRVHTPRGAPARVAVHRSGGRVLLEVADTGPGMAEEERVHAFDRFYRADPSRSRDSGGSGLGLAIVAAIVRGYGGAIAVESAPAAGARFTVDLPAAAPSKESHG